MSIIAHSSFTARGIAARQAAKAVDPEAIERRRIYEEQTRREEEIRRRRAHESEMRMLRERNRTLEERAAKLEAEAEAARRYIEEHGIKPARRATTMHEIARRFCKATGVSMEEIKGPRRSRRIVIVRHAIIYWARRRTKASSPQIAAMLGRLDHTTILTAVGRYPSKRAAMGRHLRPLDTGKRGT
ncbi:helix-turn-helix domain-containing protein [Aurantimonas coralicida]|uniref:helix-turn-helix domain-containing protein n=1 Tax=Aurantimonas coralicida TaxID=182270 RepID=UPI001E56F297|nr:helix-turn-helix domain-containing protein [Aurantimonas coralicida]MCD1645185.1 hypothetical protein [Aurantimonas coralicida]